MITSTFPDAERSRAIGTWTAVAGGGGMLGMYLSALLVVLTAAALLIGARAVPESRERVPGRFDLHGALTSVVATVGFTLALHEAPSRGWDSPLVVAALVAAVLATLGFVGWELRTPSPLLDVRHFRSRGLSSGTTLLLVLFGVQGGVALVLYPYFQAVLGWSGLLSTVAMMPLAVLMMIASGVAPGVARRVGARTTMALGLAVATTGLALLAALVSPDGGTSVSCPVWPRWVSGPGSP